MLPNLTTFARNLCWTGPLLDCCRAWLDACGDLLDQRLRAHCERNPRLAWLLAAYQKWPQDLRRDFVLSPRVSVQFRLQDAAYVPTFAAMAPDFVRVLARSSSGAATDPDVAEMLAVFGRDHGELRGIPLDFQSTFSFPSRGANGAPLHGLQPDQAAQAEQRLETALEALGQGNPIALEYVRLLTRRLAVREEKSRAGSFGSSSFGDFMGLTLLTNVWAEWVDTGRLVDALVHEAIHAGLFLHETILEPLIADRSWPTLLRSPWSGNPLDGYQFVQACFVWFGLAQLWGSWPAGAGGIPAPRVRQMHRLASEGILARPVESLLGQAGGLIPPSVQDALRWMEQNALERWGCPKG